MNIENVDLLPNLDADSTGPSGIQQHVTSSEPPDFVTALSVPESNKRKRSRSSTMRGT